MKSFKIEEAGRHIRQLLVLCMGLGAACQLLAQELVQHIQVADESVSYMGHDILIPVVQSSSASENGITGLGLRLHYDSTAFDQVSVENLHQQNLLSMEDQADRTDADGDPTTDRMIVVAWMAISGSVWESGAGDTLFELRGTVLGPSRINFSSVGTAAGYAFSADSFEVTP